MLVIRRRAGEKLLIGEEIEIEVLEIAGTRVKLGIVAPGTIAVVRKEAQATREQNVAAARSTGSVAIHALARSLPRPPAVNFLTVPANLEKH